MFAKCLLWFLFALKTCEMSQSRKRFIIWNLDCMAIDKMAFEGYNRSEKLCILERAFAHVLQKPVKRGERVIYKDNMEDSWADLEAQGGIALDDYSTNEDTSSKPRQEGNCNEDMRKMIGTEGYIDASNASFTIVDASSFVECKANVRFCP